MTQAVIDGAVSRAREIIENFDFGYVVERCIKEGMPQEAAAPALAQLKRFLFQCAVHPDKEIVPQSYWCDVLWHWFIVVDTKAYFRFCTAVYGEYLHHNGAALAPERMAAARANTAALLPEEAATVDCVREAKSVDCVREAATVDCVREAKSVDCVRDTVSVDCVREAKTVDCVREAKTVDCVREAASVDCVREAKSVDCVREAATIDCVREPAAHRAAQRPAAMARA